MLVLFSIKLTGLDGACGTMSKFPANALVRLSPETIELIFIVDLFVMSQQYSRGVITRPFRSLLPAFVLRICRMVLQFTEAIRSIRCGRHARLQQSCRDPSRFCGDTFEGPAKNSGEATLRLATTSIVNLAFLQEKYSHGEQICLSKNY
jgi:hypothetical protein